MNWWLYDCGDPSHDFWRCENVNWLWIASMAKLRNQSPLFLIEKKWASLYFDSKKKHRFLPFSWRKTIVSPLFSYICTAKHSGFQFFLGKTNSYLVSLHISQGKTYEKTMGFPRVSCFFSHGVSDVFCRDRPPRRATGSWSTMPRMGTWSIRWRGTRTPKIFAMEKWGFPARHGGRMIVGVSWEFLIGIC